MTSVIAGVMMTGVMMTGAMIDAGDFYMVAITALLPLTAILLVLQVNPYQALVIRGILGAIAALVYALFGAADVALTEALVGTMLSITLYAVAVRSSMIMRIGAIADSKSVLLPAPDRPVQPSLPKQLLSALEKTLNRYHVRVEVLTYPDISTMMAALKEKEIHACYSSVFDISSSSHTVSDSSSDTLSSSGLLQNGALGSLQIRVKRLYNILQPSLSPAVNLTYIEQVADADRVKLQPSNLVGESP